MMMQIMTGIEILRKLPNWIVVRIYYNNLKIVEDSAYDILKNTNIELGTRVDKIIPIDGRTIQLNTVG